MSSTLFYWATVKGGEFQLTECRSTDILKRMNLLKLLTNRLSHVRRFVLGTPLKVKLIVKYVIIEKKFSRSRID